MTIPIISRTEPVQQEIDPVLALVDAAAEVDGVAPVSEHVLLHLRHGGDQRGHNLLAHSGTGTDVLVGYAHLDPAEPDAEPGAELVVHPAHRRRGVAGALLTELERISDQTGAGGRLLVWAHGRHPGAAALARRRGYVEQRVLWKMRRSLLTPLPDLAVPADIRIRPFRVGQDEQVWTEVNNRAFATHPDQGGWTVEDVRVREAEPWFDPRGFLLAEQVDDGTVVGFHWTKVHGGGQGTAGADDTADEPVGEVYVVGVDPAAQRRGLGQALTLAGLHHLRSVGLSTVILYVDESNTAAIGVYTRLGFTRWDTDVQYRRVVDPATGSTGTPPH